MKKTMILLLLLVFILPTQALGAAKYTYSSIEKIYFADYKEKVKEVRAAQKKLSGTTCTNVQTLTTKSKASIANYNSLVKSKASKEVLAKAKEERENDKKQLKAAKKECSVKKQSYKKESDRLLKEIAAQKTELLKVIKTNFEGKGKLSQQELESTIHSGLTSMNAKFEAALKVLKTDLG